MTHPVHRVARFDVVGPYPLAVAFTDGTEQRINFRPVLHGAVFGPLQDLATFNAVTLDSEVGTLAWPNGADFDPATLHDWHAVCEELTARDQGSGMGGRNTESMSGRLYRHSPVADLWESRMCGVLWDAEPRVAGRGLLSSHPPLPRASGSTGSPRREAAAL